MEKRLSVVTLGVQDVSQAQAFYEALGWQLDSGVDDESDHIAFFQVGGSIVSLRDRGKLAADSGVSDGGGWGGVTLGHAVGSPRAPVGGPAQPCLDPRCRRRDHARLK